MARNHARIFTRIWTDEDFLDLSGDEQRLYLLLLSQQNLSHAGLLPLTITRWANKAQDWSIERTEHALSGLEYAEYVVVDRRTEELLVRSLMRVDEVWKHWKVMTAAARDVEAIASATLRRVVADEVARILLLPALTDPKSRSLLEGLRDALPNPTDCQPDANPSPQGQGKGTLVTTEYLPPPPTPATTPAPVADAEPIDDPTGRLIVEHSNAYAQPPPPSALTPVKREIMRLVTEGVPEDRIRAGLARLREKRLAASLLPQLVTETTPVARASTTDQRVAAGLALAARYEEAGE